MAGIKNSINKIENKNFVAVKFFKPTKIQSLENFSPIVGKVFTNFYQLFFKIFADKFINFAVVYLFIYLLLFLIISFLYQSIYTQLYTSTHYTSIHISIYTYIHILYCRGKIWKTPNVYGWGNFQFFQAHFRTLKRERLHHTKTLTH